MNWYHLLRSVSAGMVFCLGTVPSVPGQELPGQELPGQEWPGQELQPGEPARIVQEVETLVQEHFFDPTVDHRAWRARTAGLRDDALAARSLDEFSAAVNAWLATLKASHTSYFSRNNPRRYQLLGVFHALYDADNRSLFVYDGIGIRTQKVGDRRFVLAVYDGHPAKQSGIRFGDQLLTVDGGAFHPMDSFRGKSGSTVEVTLIRDQKILSVDVLVQEMDGRTMFHTALEASFKTIESSGKRIGYAHAWSYAGFEYHRRIQDAILWGELSQCDALILDVRDGWGGADLSYLNLFREPIATIESIPRRGPAGSFSGVWEKPVVMLTNERSTSGKELLAFGFKKLGLGPLVGARTAGAVVAGRAFVLSNGDVLYLAVRDVKVDGQRLEGVGVPPDVRVRRQLGDAAVEQLPASESDFRSDDPQLERAVQLLTES